MVSIIVPVYNAEATINRCLDSISRQTLRDIEVVIVNDGSTDNSSQLIREYTEKDPRFRLIEKENTGVSDSRNVGIDNANGEYIQFVDSDDWLSEDASQSLLNAMLLYDTDMVISDFTRVYERSTAVMGNLPKNGSITCAEFATHMMKSPGNYYYGVLWNKLYRSEIVKRMNVRCLPGLRWGEDFLFNIEYLHHTRNIAVIHEPIYFYVKRKDSLVYAETSLYTIIKFKALAFPYYKKFYEKLGLYENHKLRIQLYHIAIARDR